jgi:5-hydroxyisourate hydrolase-like protein (transthyretin family)
MPGDPAAGRLTVHVLDTASGRSAALMPLSLFRIVNLVRPIAAVDRFVS